MAVTRSGPYNKERGTLDRALGRRPGKQRILISCEGEKTEPYYFEGLCKKLRVNRANVEILSSRGRADAISVVQAARKRASEFDRIFAVLDGDQKNGGNLEEAKKVASSRKPRVELIVTHPCFEFWLLLHFVYSDKPYDSCAPACADLQEYLPDYAKNDRDIFLKVENGLEAAVMHARKLTADSTVNQGNPSTQVSDLVEVLQDMGKP